MGLGYCCRSVDCATTLSTQAQNNGNVLQQTITRSGAGAWTDNYTYDAVNRLTQASESGAGSWSESNCYDALSNRWVVAPRSGLPTSLETPHGTSCSGPGQYNRNNKITGWSYERGNVTQVFAMSRSFAYSLALLPGRVVIDWRVHKQMHALPFNVHGFSLCAGFRTKSICPPYLPSSFPI
ncbi:MAG: hypothetical protein ACR2NN_25210 [Bryobacteraceae bacterium]